MTNPAAHERFQLENILTIKGILQALLVIAPAKVPLLPYQRAVAEGRIDEAFPLLREAAAQNDPEAMTLLASFYYEGYSVPKDLTEAALWYRQAAVRGNPEAAAALGSMLTEGAGVEKNVYEAAFWLYRAAQAGDSAALDWLADLILRCPDVVGDHFTHHEIAQLHKQRGTKRLLGEAA